MYGNFPESRRKYATEAFVLTAVKYASLQDRKAANTNAGTFTSGARRTRDINTEVTDTGSVVTLANNQFTLQPGTYQIIARAPALHVGRHQAYLRNVTDSVDTLVGSSAFSDSTADYAQSDSWVIGRFTITAAKTFEIQHQCQTTYAAAGFGVAVNLGASEVYTEVHLWKES